MCVVYLTPLITTHACLYIRWKRLKRHHSLPSALTYVRCYRKKGRITSAEYSKLPATWSLYFLTVQSFFVFSITQWISFSRAFLVMPWTGLNRATAASFVKERQISGVWRQLHLIAAPTYVGRESKCFIPIKLPFAYQVIWDLCWVRLQLTHFSCLFSRVFLLLSTINLSVQGTSLLHHGYLVSFKKFLVRDFIGSFENEICIIMLLLLTPSKTYFELHLQ